MNAIHPRRRHHRRSQPVYFPRWLLRLAAASLTLSIVLMLRACALENDRVDRAAAIFSGVRSWARSSGAGEVMFGTVTSREIDGNTCLAEGQVYRSLSDPAATPILHHWICTRDGKVVRAFAQSAWDVANTRERNQPAGAGP